MTSVDVLAGSRLCAALVVLSETSHRAIRMRQALGAAREAVELGRRLAADDPVRAEPDLAQALRALAHAEMSVTGEMDLAVAAAEDALAIHDRLFEELPAAYHEERFLTLTTVREARQFRDTLLAELDADPAPFGSGQRRRGAETDRYTG